MATQIILDFELAYTFCGEVRRTKSSDACVDIKFSSGRRVRVDVTAKRPVKLVSATITIPYEYHQNERIFANGYQSWTDTREYIAGESFRDVRHLPGFVTNMFSLDGYGDSAFKEYRQGVLHGYDISYAGDVFVGSFNWKNAYLIINNDVPENKLVLESDIYGLCLGNGAGNGTGNSMGNTRDNTTGNATDNTMYSTAGDVPADDGSSQDGSQDSSQDSSQPDAQPDAQRNADGICLFDFTLDRDTFLAEYPVKDIPDILGYTSWYNYYEKIDEQKILQSLDSVGNMSAGTGTSADGAATESVANVKFDLFQIDDGYETAVGDWLSIDPVKFPNGLAGIVDKIHAKGMKAGIWLAPFAAESKSTIYKEHPEWFFDYKSGGNWSGFYGLNSDNADAMEYVGRCLRYYADMGFDFFKLDFLYAVNPREISSRTRAQITQSAYEFIREKLPDKTILGCGAMIMNSSCFDYLRVGPDVSLKFDDTWYMRLLHRERISTKVTIQNTIYRSFLDKRLFGCDPDVFILRDENNKLTAAQKEALITINALFGSVMMTSDNVSEYDAQKKELFMKALNLRRATEKGYRCTGRRYISIWYTLDGKKHSLKYDTKKGILEERGR